MDSKDSNGMQRMMDTAEASEYLHLSSRTLEAMRRTGNGPKFARVSSRCVRYRVSDLQAWINEKIRSSTSIQVTNANE